MATITRFDTDNAQKAHGDDSNGRCLKLELQAEDICHQVAKLYITGERVTLRVEADKEKYSFYYSVDGSSIKYLSSVSTRFVSNEIVGRCFTGTVIGLYAASISSSDSRMTVYDFSMR